METDVQTGDSVLVGWNGDNPTAEIFRLRVRAVSSYIVIDLSNSDSEGAYTPTSIVGDPLNSKESCVLIDSNTSRAWTRTFVSATTATFSTDLVIDSATVKQIGRQTWDYNSNTGKVVENAVWTASINDSVTTPDSTEDLESITVDYFGTTIKYEAKACAGRIIFTTYTPDDPYRWPTGSIVVKATDEKGNTLTSSAEIKAKIESGAAIQVIATAFGSLGRGSYVPNKIQLIYDYDHQTPATTIGGLSVFFISNDNYVDFREGRKLFINLRQTNVTGEVYMELGKKINDLSNVTITTPMPDQVLTYNGNTNKWENRSVGGDFFIDLTDGQEMFNFTQAEWTCTSFEVDDLKAAIADGKRIVIRAKNYLWGGDDQTPDKMYFVCSQAIDSNTGSQVVLAFTDGSRRYNALVAYTGTISSLNVLCALIQVDTSWI